MIASAWSPTPIRGDVSALATRGMRAAAALRGEVWLSSDGGVQWYRLPLLPDHPAVTAIAVSSRSVLVGTAGSGVFSTDEMERWHPARAGLGPGRTVLSFACRRETVLAGTLRSGVFRSTDRGLSWTAANTGLPLHGERLEIPQIAATARGWVALHAFGASHSPDGDRWTPVVAGLPMHRAPTTLAVLADDFYADVGARLYRLGPDYCWNATGSAEPIRLVGEASGALLAVLRDGRTLGRSTDAGQTWDPFQADLPSAELVTTVGATQRAVLVALDGEGLWVRRLAGNPLHERTMLLQR